jgi:hypothetical protein
MSGRGGRVLAALFAAVCVALASLLWPLPFRSADRFRVARPRRRRLIALIALVGLLAPGGHLVLDRARSWRRSPLRTTVSSRAYGVLPLSHPVAAALPPGRSVAAPRLITVVAPPERNALIVGINHARGSRPLQGSITDATNVRDALLRYGFPKRNITLLTEGAATRSAILNGIHSLAARTPASGIAVFAVATHTRIRGGENKLVAADGELIGAHELAGAIGQVKAKTWTALATCYAQGYGLPGIVGHDRIATFGSSAHQLTYQLGSAGSYMIINMVREAMLDGHAPRSIEASFEYARATLQRSHPDRVPVMSDGVPGDLALGPVTWAAPSRAREERPPKQPGDGRSFAAQDTTSAPSSTPEPEDGRRQSVVGVCGRFQYKCNR